jgi:hypothetical protein
MLRLSLLLSSQNGLKVQISALKSPFSPAAIIHFFDRMPIRVHLGGTQNVVNACKAVGMTVLIATSSSCTAGLYRPATLIWSFRTTVNPSTHLFQVIKDETVILEAHAEACGYYVHTKIPSERIITAVDKARTANVLELYVPVTPSTDLEATASSTISSPTRS